MHRLWQSALAHQYFFTTDTQINQPPLAIFTTSAAQGAASLSVNLNASDSSDASPMTRTIVYSTRPQAEKKSSFIQHLRQTCGLKPVEILAYTNPGTQSLSEIYNHALNQARHPFIVFIHDDIIFETPAWGTKIIHSFQNTDYGILGIAGTAQLPASGIWWQEPLRSHSPLNF